MRTQRKRTEKRHILRSLFKLLTPTGQKFVKRYIFSPMLAVMFGLGSASVWGLGVTNTADLATFNPSYTGEVFTPGTVIANKDCVVNLNTIIGNNTIFQSKNGGTFTFTEGVEISSSRTAPFVFDFNAKFSGNGSLTVNAETIIPDGEKIITSETSSAIISNRFTSTGTTWNGEVTITSGNGNYTGTGDTFNSLLTIKNGAEALLEKGTAGTIDVNTLGKVQLGKLNDDGTFIKESGASAGTINVYDAGSEVNMYGSTADSLIVDNATGNVNNDSTVGSMTVQNAGTGTLNNSEVTNKLIVQNANSSATLTDSKAGNMEVTDGAKATLEKNSEVTNKLTVKNANSSAILTDSEAGNMDVTGGATADLNNGSKVLKTINVSGTGEGQTIENPLRSTVTLNSGSSAKDMNVTEGAEAKLNNGNVTNNMTVTGEGSSATLEGNSTVGGLLDVNGAIANVNNESTVDSMTVQNAGTGNLNSGNVTNDMTVTGEGSSATLEGNSTVGGLLDVNGAIANVNNGSTVGSMTVQNAGTGNLNSGNVTKDMTVTGEGSSATLKGNSTVGGLLNVNGAIANVNEGSTVGSMTVQNAGTGNLNAGKVTNDMTVTGEGSEAKLEKNSTVGSMTVQNAGTGTLDNSEVTNKLTVQTGGSAQLTIDSFAKNIDVDAGHVELIQSGTEKMTVKNGAWAFLADAAHAETINVSDAGSKVDMYGSTANLLTIEEGAFGYLVTSNVTDQITVDGTDGDNYSRVVLLDGSYADSIDVINGAYARLDNNKSYQGTTKTHAGTITVSGKSSQVNLFNGSTADMIKVGGHEFDYNVDGEITDCTVSVAGINGSEVTDLIIGTKNEDGTWKLANGYVQNGSSVTNLTVQGSDNGFYSYASISGEGTKITNLLSVTDGAYAVLEDACAKTINVSDAGSEVDLINAKAGSLSINSGAWGLLKEGTIINSMKVDGTESRASVNDSKVEGNLDVTAGAWAMLDNSTIGRDLNIHDSGSRVDMENTTAQNMNISNGAWGFLETGNKVTGLITVDGTDGDNYSRVLLWDGSYAGSIDVINGAYARLDNNESYQGPKTKAEIITVSGSNENAGPSQVDLLNGSTADSLTIKEGAFGYLDTGSTVTGQITVDGADGDNYSRVLLWDGSSAGSINVIDGAYARLDNRESYQGPKTNAGTIIVSGSNENAGPSQVDLLNGSAADSLSINKGAHGYLKNGIINDSMKVDGSGSIALVNASTIDGNLDVTAGAWAMLDNSTIGRDLNIHDSGSRVDMKGAIAQNMNISNGALGFLETGNKVKGLITVDGTDGDNYSRVNLWDGSSAGSINVINGAHAHLDNSTNNASGEYTHAGTITVSGENSQVDLLNGSTADSLTVSDSAHGYLAHATIKNRITVDSGAQVDWYAKNSKLGTEEDNGSVVIGENAVLATQAEIISTADIELNAGTLYITDNRYKTDSSGNNTADNTTDSSENVGTVDDDRYEIVGTVDPEYNESDSSGNNTADNTTDSSENGPTVALGNNTTGDPEYNESDNSGNNTADNTTDSSEKNKLESSGNNAYDSQLKNPEVVDREATQNDFPDLTNNKGNVDEDRYNRVGTVDSEGMVTLLHYDNTKSFIENAKGDSVDNEKDEKEVHDHILTGSLSGNGTLRVQFDFETTGALILQGDASGF